MSKGKGSKAVPCLALAALILLAGLPGCSGAGPAAEKGDPARSPAYDQKDAKTDSAVKSGGGFVSVAERGGLELFVDGATAGVAVKNLQSGKWWHSAPRLAAGEEEPGNWPMLQSQILLRYVDNQQKTYEVNSFDEAVAKGQYSFYPLDDGIRVDYVLGSPPKVYLIPDALSVERFEEILGKLSEMDRETLKTFYIFMSAKNLEDADKALMTDKFPILAKTDIYILSTNRLMGKENLSDMLLDMIEPIFQKAGYDEKQLEADTKASGVPVRPVVDSSVKLSVEYTLGDSGFSVNIPRKSVGYDETSITVTDLSLMPFFGTAGQVGEGYLFVPDGPGALIDLNKAKNNLSGYRKKVYGEDATLSKPEIPQGDGTLIHLPVYGMKIGGDAFLAVIEDGDAGATIVADVKNNVNPYPYIYSEFRLRESNLETMSVLNVAGKVVYQQQPLKSDLRLKYLFLSGNSADYTGMARAYQAYLLRGGGLESAQPEPVGLYVDLLGAVRYETSVFGIPVADEKPLTTYAQAAGILSRLRQSGAKDVALGYTGWQNGGMQHTQSTDIRLVPGLGGKKAFDRLLKTVEDTESVFYPAVDFAYVYNTKGFSANRNAAKNLSGLTAKKFEYDLSLLEKKEESKTVIVSPGYYAEMARRYAAASKKRGLTGTGLLNLGRDLNADYDEKGAFDRQQAKAEAVRAVRELAGSGMKVQVGGAHVYTLAGASLITGMPLASGGHYLFDRSVPFYPIVVHGVIPFAGQPLNLSVDYETDVLLAAESGAVPAFEWMYADNAAFKDTDYDYYSVHYGEWLAKAAELCKRFEPLEDCRRAKIVSHVRRGGTAKTVFDNGAAVAVNFGGVPAAVDGKTVPAKDFIVYAAGGGGRTHG